jgi:hypothetical protein
MYGDRRVLNLYSFFRTLRVPQSHVGVYGDRRVLWLFLACLVCVKAVA